MIPNVMKPSKEIVTPSELEKWTTWVTMIGSVKKDGIGMRVINGVGYSCSNKPIPNLLLQDWVKSNATKLEGLHGELFKSDFNTTQSVVMSQFGRLKGLEFHVFDSFVHPERPYHERLTKHARSKVESLRLKLNPKVYLVEFDLCITALDAVEAHAKAIDNGHEGLVLRDLNGVYEFKRVTLASRLSVKMKPYCEGVAVIKRIEPQTHNTSESVVAETGRLKKFKKKDDLQNLQMVGSFAVESGGVEFKVSASTLSVEQKETLWARRSSLIGKKITYSKMDYGEKNKPRGAKIIVSQNSWL